MKNEMATNCELALYTLGFLIDEEKILEQTFDFV